MSFSLKKPLAAFLSVFLLSASASTMATVTTSALEPHGTGLTMRDWLVNDPNYTFSEAYKSSVWYENFTNLRLGENDRNNILRIAISQLGYHEGDSSADFGGTNTEGTGNYIEYARLLVPHYNDNAYDWCACFVNWCLNQARFVGASSEISCGNWVNELKTMDMWQSSPAYGGTYIPRPADFIFFDWDETGKWPEHIGLVLYVTDTEVYTIEGNTKANDVGIRSYPLQDTRILGYGTPPYHEGDEPVVDFSKADGMPAGIYVVGGAATPLTDRDGQNPTVTVPLGTPVTFLSETEERVQVAYGLHTGYLPKDSLCLLTQSYSLTYDANGGKNPPDGMTAHQALPFALSHQAPTLRGDTFLGWSTVPYNCKVEYKAGDTIVLHEDTVLYAVWETHSRDLAQEAAAQGLVPEYERPTKIEHSGALLLSALPDYNPFTDCGDTAARFTVDAEMGRIPAFSLDGDAPHATLDCKALSRTLGLAPVTGEETAFVILRVKDATQSGLSLRLTLNDGDSDTPSLPFSAHGDWQYLVFDLTERGFTGDLHSLRLDWTATNPTAESRLLLSEVWFASSAAVKDAVLAGRYVYPKGAAEATEPEPPTTPVTTQASHEADTTAPGAEPSDSSTPVGEEQTGDTTTAATSESGCTSALDAAGTVAVSIIGMTVAATVRTVGGRRKKE